MLAYRQFFLGANTKGVIYLMMRLEKNCEITDKDFDYVVILL